MPGARLDFLSYVRAPLGKIKQAAELSDREADPARYSKPFWHPTSDDRLIIGLGRGRRRRALRRHDRIWLMHQVEIGGVDLPPALDGMVEVDAVRRMSEVPAWLVQGSSEASKSHAVMATEDSFWCPWVSGVDAFSRLQFRTLTGHGKPLQTAGRGWLDWGYRLQRSRWLTPDDAAVLERLAAETKHRPRVFISFAWSDGAAYAGEMAKILGESGFSVWLDHFAVPRRIGRGAVEAPQDRFLAYLRQMVCGSAAFVQLATPRARDQSEWCRAERQAASGVPSLASVVIDLPKLYGGNGPVADAALNLMKDAARSLVRQLKGKEPT